MDFINTIADRVAAAWRARAVTLKAVSFACVGVVNAAVDYAVFFLALHVLRRSAGLVALAEMLTSACGCLNAATWIIIPANVFAWMVAVSGSYVMNSYVTFAVESGRQLSWRAYAKFVASGIAGLVANTTTVVIAALFVPVWMAKLMAILVAFAVNFSLSHFVVFGTSARDSSRGT